MSKKSERDEAILKHGLALQRIYPASQKIGPVALYQRLHRLEAEAHRLAERQCNEDVPETYVANKEDSILKRLYAILGYTEGVFLNGDPRGYALKISDKHVKEHKLDIYTDWGGYGILAPEF